MSSEMMLLFTIEEIMMKCMWKQHFGMDCLGCGFQRSFMALLKGNVMESLQLYPALIPFLGMVTFLFVHLKLKFTYGGTILKWWFMATSAIAVVSWILKTFVF